MSGKAKTVHISMNTVRRSLMLCMVMVALIQSTYGQLRDSYKAAAETYRKAAQMTACDDRRNALLRNAEWNECWVRKLENGTTNECPPAPSIPDCAGDKVGAAGSSGNMSSSPATAASSGGSYQTAITSIGDLVWSGMQNKRLATRSLGEQMVVNIARQNVDICTQSTLCSVITCDECDGSGRDSEGYDMACGKCSGGKSIAVLDRPRAKELWQMAVDDSIKHLGEVAVWKLSADLDNAKNSSDPIVVITTPSYKGSIQIKVIIKSLTLLGTTFVLDGSTGVDFIDKRGESDMNAPIINYVDYVRMFPISQIDQFVLLGASSTLSGEDRINSPDRICLKMLSGQSFEFLCKENSLSTVNKLNQSLALAKSYAVLHPAR